MSSVKGRVIHFSYSYGDQQRHLQHNLHRTAKTIVRQARPIQSSMAFSWFLISMALLHCNVFVTGTNDYEYVCPDSYILNNDDKTCIKVHEGPKMNYADAREVCQKENTGDLVHMQCVDSNTFIKDLLTAGRRYWIGVTKTGEGDDVSYVSGNLLSFNAPWASGEPNNYRNNERCVEIIANGRGTWNDKRCSKTRPFVCQIAAEIVVLKP